MEPVGAILPELYLIRYQTQASPVLGARDRATDELLVQFAQTRLKRSTTRYRGGLRGCVRADLCSSRSVRKIIIGITIGHAFNRPTQANLLTLDRPMKAHGSAAVDLQMLALGTLEIGEEHQTAG